MRTAGRTGDAHGGAGCAVGDGQAGRQRPVAVDLQRDLLHLHPQAVADPDPARLRGGGAHGAVSVVQQPFDVGGGGLARPFGLAAAELLQATGRERPEGGPFRGQSDPQVALVIELVPVRQLPLGRVQAEVAVQPRVERQAIALVVVVAGVGADVQRAAVGRAEQLVGAERRSMGSRRRLVRLEAAVVVAVEDEPAPAAAPPAPTARRSRRSRTGQPATAQRRRRPPGHAGRPPACGRRPARSSSPARPGRTARSSAIRPRTARSSPRAPGRSARDRGRCPGRASWSGRTRPRRPVPAGPGAAGGRAGPGWTSRRGRAAPG